jgi:predicted lysophospholipase L1 biosynthesis ABC-type transport system permease subunit
MSAAVSSWSKLRWLSFSSPERDCWDVKRGGLDREPTTEVYLFAEQASVRRPINLVPATMNVVLRSPLPTSALATTISSAVKGVDPGIPIVRLQDMESVVAESISRPRLLAELVSAFAGLALLLATVGTYGVLAYIAAERRREIGIRMALGANRSSLVALVMGQGLQLIVVGLGLGVAGALGANRLIASLLFGVKPTDAETLVVVTAAILMVSTVACALPAWRASQLDPIVVLRDE